MIAGRNQRPAKGLKVKHAIQIALILAVCFWLLYQMKQSHGKDYSESSKDKASEAVLIFSDVRGVQGGQKVEETEIQKKELNNKDDNSGGEVKGNDESVGLDKCSSHEENYQEGHEGTQAIFADQDGAKHGNHDEVGEDKEQIPQDKHDEKENERG
ncbi:hypothetical protein ACFX14_026247 [Malus domestica]